MTEDILRAGKICAKCGEDKDTGLIFCWNCWRSFKVFTGTAEQFINADDCATCYNGTRECFTHNKQ